MHSESRGANSKVLTCLIPSGGSRGERVPYLFLCRTFTFLGFGPYIAFSSSAFVVTRSPTALVSSLPLIRTFVTAFRSHLDNSGQPPVLRSLT